MGDSYRPDRRRPYYDSDKPDPARGARDSSLHGDYYRGDAPRARSSQGLNYEPRDDSNDYYRRFGVYNPQYESYTRSDDLRYPNQEPRYFDGRPVLPVSYDSPLETGKRDISSDGDPLRFVLVRGLKPSITEALFAKGMEKFYNGFDELPGGAPEKSLRRVFLVKERRSNENVGYGFAEYRTTIDAQHVVNKVDEFMKAKRKCTIRSSEITLHFPHQGVFPRIDAARPEYNDKYTFTMYGTGMQHKYHDERYYTSEFVVNDDPPVANTLFPENERTTEKPAKKTGKKRGTDTLEGNAKKVKVLGGTVPAYLQHWQNKHAELRGEAEKPATEEPKLPATGVNALTATLPALDNPEHEQTYAYEGETIGCYLCGSEFTTREHLLKHLNHSKLHASNLKDDKVCYRATKRLKEKNIDLDDTFKLPKVPAVSQSAAAQGTEESKYRDRAAERRGGEEKFTGFSLKGVGQKKKKTSSNVPDSSSGDDSSKPTYGKGAKMLQKAGWSEGEGLGSGGGITAPIDQNLYASGVGLGHESSKKGDAVEEASRMTKNDRGEFLEKTRELARKRYEEMG